MLLLALFPTFSDYLWDSFCVAVLVRLTSTNNKYNKQIKANLLL